MSILQQKQQEQGAQQIVKKVNQLLEKYQLKAVAITWDLGQLDYKKPEHTLTVMIENGIVKESITSRQLEDSYSYVRPSVDECINKMISRLVEQIRSS